MIYQIENDKQERNKLQSCVPDRLVPITVPSFQHGPMQCNLYGDAHEFDQTQFVSYQNKSFDHFLAAGTAFSAAFLHNAKQPLHNLLLRVSHAATTFD